MIKHVIFDFDGTIVDSIELGIDIIHSYMDKHSERKFSKEELRKMASLPVKERLKLMGVPLYRLPGLSTEFLNIYRHELPGLKAYDGIQELMGRLRAQGYGLSIISSNRKDIILQFLSNNMMTDFTYVLSEKNIFGKDKPIRHLLKILGLDPNEAVYVGDELRDIEACKKVPIRIISATWGVDCHTLIQKGEPNHIAEHPMEILDILKEME